MWHRLLRAQGRNPGLGWDLEGSEWENQSRGAHRVYYNWYSPRDHPGSEMQSAHVDIRKQGNPSVPASGFGGERSGTQGCTHSLQWRGGRCVGHEGSWQMRYARGQQRGQGCLGSLQGEGRGG